MTDGPDWTALVTRPVRPSVAAPCAGVAYCRVVDRADLDGDARPDPIAVVGHFTPSYGSESWSPADHPRLRVLVGGRVLDYAIKLDEAGWDGPVYGGAAEVDDQPGREVIVGFMQGMHSAFYTMLRFRGGRIATVAGPGRNYYGPGDVGSWAVDSSIAANNAVTCLSPGRIRTDDAYIEDAPAVGQYETRSQQWVWTGSRWRRSGPETHQHVVYADTGVPARFQRWHCAGFAH